MLGWYCARYDVQISFGQRQELAKCAGVFYDSKDGAARAVAPEPGFTPFAIPAGQIDLANHAPAGEFRIIRFHYFANEFMPRRASKAVVSPLQFEVGVADASVQQADGCEAFGPA